MAGGPGLPAVVHPDGVDARSDGAIHVQLQAVSDEEGLFGSDTELLERSFEDSRMRFSPSHSIGHDDGFEHLPDTMTLQTRLERG